MENLGLQLKDMRSKEGTHLFQSFIVDETRSILWDLKLPLLDLLAKLPVRGYQPLLWAKGVRTRGRTNGRSENRRLTWRGK